MTMLKNIEDGTIINVKMYAIFEDDKEGVDEPITILSIMDNDGTVYASNSSVVRRSFEDIADIFFEDDEEFAIEKISGTTKSGRSFVNVTLA